VVADVEPLFGEDPAVDRLALLKPGDFDWTKIFAGGVRWFHSGGIFAALSATTSDLIIEGMKAAHAAGAITSFDLNYREKLWAASAGKARALRDRVRSYLGPKSFVDKDVEVLTSKDISANKIHNLLPTDRASATLKMAQTMLRLANYVGHFDFKWFRQIINIVHQIDAARNQLLSKAAICEGVFSQKTYAALVLSEDNVELDTAVWIAAARKSGVRSVIVPYTISNVAEFAESYVHHEPYQVRFNVLNRLVAWLLPKWVLSYKGRRFLRSSYPRVIAMEMLGLAPPNPWFLNSGYADVIAVESTAMEKRYRAAEVPARQLSITGSLADDVMTKVLVATPRQVFLQKQGLEDGKPVLLCAFPPDQNTFDRPGCEFSSFDQMIEFWGGALGKLRGWSVVIRPHPKTKRERLEKFGKCGLKISFEDTAALIPFCDVYIASASATIRWAIACGKPVINYDVYQYGYDDYANVEGVLLVNTCREFLKMLDSTTEDGSFRSRLRSE